MYNKYKIAVFLIVIVSFIPSCTSENTIKIAMCQIFCLDGDREGNFVRIENALREAKDKGAEIVCFPETTILGWVNVDAHERAYPIPGKDSDRLCQLAKDYKVHICIGLAEKNANKLHDSVLLIDDQGNILLNHHKINILSELMIPSYTPGNSVNTVETRFGNIGLMICTDSFLQEYVEEMSALKPDLLLIPYGWAAPEEDWPEHAKKLINKSLDYFKEHLKDFNPKESIFNFPFNSSIKELENWLNDQVLAYRTAGNAINALPYIGQKRLTCISAGPENIDQYFENQLQQFLDEPKGWFIFNAHGLDGEGWGPLSSAYLDELLDRLNTMPHVRMIPVGEALLTV